MLPERRAASSQVEIDGPSDCHNVTNDWFELPGLHPHEDEEEGEDDD